MIISIDAKIFDKIKQTFKKKRSLTKLEIERNVFNLIKGIYKILHLTVYFM